jgi:hypothetical protein
LAGYVVLAARVGGTTATRLGMMALSYFGAGRSKGAAVVEVRMKGSCELALRLGSLCLLGTKMS